MKTPLASSILADYLQTSKIGQEEFSLASGIDRSAISYHINHRRPIRGEHLPHYLVGLPQPVRSQFIAAWLRDIAPPAITADLLNDAALSPQVLSWNPTLSADLAARLEWLAGEMTKDPDLCDMVRSLIDRLGFPKTPPAISAPVFFPRSGKSGSYISTGKKAAHKFKEEQP